MTNRELRLSDPVDGTAAHRFETLALARNLRARIAGEARDPGHAKGAARWLLRLAASLPPPRLP